MFRDEMVDAERFKEKFRALKKRLDERPEVQFDSEYHKQLKSYIVRLYTLTCEDDSFDGARLSDIRGVEMSNLNRLQKLKNGTSYKKEKHKTQRTHEDWG